MSGMKERARRRGLEIRWLRVEWGRNVGVGEQMRHKKSGKR